MLGEVIVGDVAPVVEVCRVVKGSVHSEVRIGVPHVVCDHIHHHQDVAIVALSN